MVFLTPTPKLDVSIDYFKKLQFKVVSESNPAVVTDGKAVFEIDPDRFARAGVKLYKKSWKDVVEGPLKEVTEITKLESGGFFLGDPNGVRIYLVQEELKVEVDKQDKSFSLLGNCAGLTLETTDMARSRKLWGLLGFKSDAAIDAGFVPLTEEESGAQIVLMKALMCPHLFFNPSLSYFNGANNPKVIEDVRKTGVEIAEEVTHFNKKGEVDNIIVREPGGFGFFLFND